MRSACGPKAPAMEGRALDDPGVHHGSAPLTAAYCPSHSDVNLFCSCERVVDLNSQISNRALDFGVPQE
jgi:hypothetical protein